MDWAQSLTERYLSTPGITWLIENRLDLLVDDQRHAYSRHHYDIAALMGRSLKRGRDLGLFFPRLSEADLAFVLMFPYVIGISVKTGMSVPGYWLNRRNLDINPHIMAVGHGPKLRQLLTQRVKIGRQAIQDYLGIYWPARSKRISGKNLFEGVGKGRDLALFIVPESKVTEDNLLNYSEECQPFAILYDLTRKSHANRDLESRIMALKEVYGNTPILLFSSCGNISAMSILRRMCISTWVMRANDIKRLDKLRHFDDNDRLTGLSNNSETLQTGITVNIQVIDDPMMDEWIRGLIGLLNQIDIAMHADSENTDKSLYYEAAVILRELSALSVPLATQEDLHQSEKRIGQYATKMLRNRIDILDSKRGSVGEVNALLNQFVRESTAITEILAKPSARTGKDYAVTQWVKDQQTHRIPSIVACPNESIKRTMITALSRRSIDIVDGDVNVLTHNEAWELGRHIIDQNTHLYWIGAIDYYSGAFFGGVYPTLTLAAYPFEREGIERQLAYIDRNTQKGSHRHGDKLLFLQDKLQVIRDIEVDVTADSQWKVQWQNLTCEGTYPGDAPPIEPFELPTADWVQEWLDEPPPLPSVPACTTTEPCMIITLSDGGPDIMLPFTASVMVLNEISSTCEGLLPATQLIRGQTILVPRDDPKRTLIDRLVDTLRNDPAFFLQEKMAERWYDAVEIIRARTGSDPERALTLLKHFNVDVDTPQAVYNWFHHLVIGPRSPASLKAIATASELPDVINHLATIWGAIKYVRRVRKQLAYQIAQHVRTDFSQHGDKLIDKELKLYRSDLEELTRIGEILHIYRR